MLDASGNRDPVDVLADEFAERCRHGDCPSVSDYATRYPQYADQIERLFPTVAMMEQLRAVEVSHREAAVRHAHVFQAPERIGDFDIIQEIGRGGMGIVYEAEQRSLARRVALKVLPRHVLLTEKHRRRFQREAQTAGKLRHTGIVPVFGVGEDGGIDFYVMQLVPGVGLDEVIAAFRRPISDAADARADDLHNTFRRLDFGRIVKELTARKFSVDAPPPNALDTLPPQGDVAEDLVRVAIRLGIQAADALQYAHAQGILHRDIKPSNLLVDEDGNTCLADFGLAQAIEPANSEQGREVVGTPRYMAPEQRHGYADARSDIHGLGLTLYELLTLQRAVEPSSIEPNATEDRTPTRPTAINRHIPRDLEAVILKCIARDPDDRYESAADLAADLRNCLEDKPVRARHILLGERALRWCRRNPTLASVSMLSGVLLLVAAISLLVGQVRTRAAHSETQAALARTEATSDVALEVLEGIYLQLSPERVWIASDSDPSGEACACVGLRSAFPVSADQHSYIQVQASEQTAALLGNLLVFYDRLADKAGNNAQVQFESAVAARRVGDIRQRLGQLDQAEREYEKAIQRFRSVSAAPERNGQPQIEIARCQNEIGNIRTARFEKEIAYAAHERALQTLQAVATSEQEAEEYRYELARTHYFLGSKDTGTSDASSTNPLEAPRAQSWTESRRLKQHRKQAIALLEALACENPDAADYRLLLAICHRPVGFSPELGQGPTTNSGRKQALAILESLKADYPQVADYRYELAATYALVHVSLFPWQGRVMPLSNTEPSLRKALREARWLTSHNPTIPHYARCQALVEAKLGAICHDSHRYAEAASFFRSALTTQETLVDELPVSASHDQALREFFRLRLAMVSLRLDAASSEPMSSVSSIAMLEECVANLTTLASQCAQPTDRLATSSLELATQTLQRIPRDHRSLHED